MVDDLLAKIQTGDGKLLQIQFPSTIFQNFPGGHAPRPPRKKACKLRACSVIAHVCTFQSDVLTIANMEGHLS